MGQCLTVKGLVYRHLSTTQRLTWDSVCLLAIYPLLLEAKQEQLRPCSILSYASFMFVPGYLVGLPPTATPPFDRSTLAEVQHSYSPPRNAKP